MVIAAYITTLVLLVAAWLWCAIGAQEQQRKADELRKQVADLYRQLGEAFGEGYQEGVKQSTTLLTTAVVTTVGDVTKLMMGEVVGERDEHKIPAAVTDQTPDPSWFTWEDTDKPIEEYGPGDSVYVPRDFDDRVAGLNPGETMIPGVPLPDMSGEEV